MENFIDNRDSDSLAVAPPEGSQCCHNPHARFIAPADTLLLVIDLQEKFAPHLWRYQRILQTTSLLSRAAVRLGVPVVVTEHNPERIGPTLPAVLEHLPSATPVRKDAFSCFGDPVVLATIKNHAAVRNILIVGCETHICVMQTSIDAIRHGYTPFVAADGVSSRREVDWRFGLDRIERAGGVVGTGEMFAYELLRRSDTREFKDLLPVFKEWVKREDG